MTALLFLLLSGITFIASFVQGSVGVGFALILAPVYGMLMPELIPASIMLLMTPLNIYVAAREREAIDTKGIFWILAGRAVGAFLGVAILLVISASELSILIGASTIGAVLLSFAAPSFTPGVKSFVAAGLVTGVTETSTGIGGPPLVLVYQHASAPTLRATLAVCFLVGQLISLVILIIGGMITKNVALCCLALLPSMALGAFCSRRVHHKIKGKGLRLGVMLFALVAGVVILLRGLF